MDKEQENNNLSNNFGENAANNVTSISENTAQMRVAAPEGLHKHKMGNDGALSQKPLESPKNGRKTGIIIIVLLVLALIGAVGGAIWYLNSRNAEKNTDTIDTDNNSEEVSDDINKETAVTELALDDELVQRLYGYFDNTMDASEPALTDLYLDDASISDLQKYAVAIGSLQEENGMTPCTKAHRLRTYADANGSDQYNDYEIGFPGCLSGELIRERMQRIFGSSNDLTKFDQEQVIVHGDGWVYYADGDEAVNVASGADFRTNINRTLYAAERDDAHVYLYEALVISCVASSDEEECFLPGGFDPEGDYGGRLGRELYEQRYYRLDTISGGNGELIEALTNTPLAVFNAIDNLALLDQFKWTFTKNADGDYIFTSLEKID